MLAQKMIAKCRQDILKCSEQTEALRLYNRMFPSVSPSFVNLPYNGEIENIIKLEAETKDLETWEAVKIINTELEESGKDKVWTLCRQVRFFYAVKTDACALLSARSITDKVNYILTWSNEIRNENDTMLSSRRQALLAYVGPIDSIERFESWLYNVWESHSLTKLEILKTMEYYPYSTNPDFNSISVMETIRTVLLIYRTSSHVLLR